MVTLWVFRLKILIFHYLQHYNYCLPRRLYFYSKFLLTIKEIGAFDLDKSLQTENDFLITVAIITYFFGALTFIYEDCLIKKFLGPLSEKQAIKEY